MANDDAPAMGSPPPEPPRRDVHGFNWGVPTSLWERAKLVAVRSRRSGPALTLSAQAERGIMMFHQRLDYVRQHTVTASDPAHSYNARVPWDLFEEMTAIKLRHGLDYHTQLICGLELLHASLASADAPKEHA